MSKMNYTRRFLFGNTKINIFTNKANFVYEVLQNYTNLRRILLLETAVKAKLNTFLCCYN